jgi:DNA-binding MarR family transcriptional regulator
MSNAATGREPGTTPAGTPERFTLLGREFSSSVVMFHEALGRSLGLSAAERKCLDVLDRLGPVSAGRIARHTGLTTGAVTGMVDRLSRAGYVRRTPNPDDRRGVLVELRPDTPLKARMAAVFGPMGQEMAGLAARFSAEELAAIGAWIQGATEIMHRSTEQLSARAEPK